MPQAPAPPSGHQLRRALCERGVALSLDETVALLGARGPELDRLLAVAARLRDLGHGDVVTYSRKVFIPLTMLCRDRCHYCVFAKAPAKLEAPFLTPEEVVSIARTGAGAGLREALFTLGDRPEDRYAVARDWLDERGFDSTLDYLRAVAIRVIEETGLLPHLNPGVMSYEEIARLKHVSASMGMMLETASPRLSAKGGLHHGSPDKVPAAWLRTIEDAGRLAVPFTTGILVGIGETDRERRSAVRDPRPAPALPARAGGDRAELPRSPARRCDPRPSPATRSSSPPSPPPVSCSGHACTCRLRRTSPTLRSVSVCSMPASTIGAASHRSPLTT